MPDDSSLTVSPTIREFKGERYWFRPNRKTYVRQMRGQPTKTLHREIYSDAYGNIPHGWHVHHKDRDRQNNSIENLVALSPIDHWAEHIEEQRAKAEANRAMLLDNLSRGRKKPRPLAAFTCTICAKEYVARPSHGLRRNICCSPACLKVSYRRRQKENKDG